MTTYEQVVTRLGLLDRESGGMAAREMLAAVAQGGEELLNAECAEPVRQRLLGAVSEAHRLAGWASGDVGLIDQCRWHMHRALDVRPEYDVRCRALDTIVLATILINAGELRDGISETRRALHLATTVGSPRVRDRLEPLEQSLSTRRDSTCQDLAQQVHSLRIPRASTAM